MSCTEVEMFLHVLVLNYKKFNTIFKCLFRNKMFSCLHFFDSLHRSQTCPPFLAELFTFTSRTDKIIPCKIRAVLSRNTLLKVTWKESWQLFSIITANPSAPQSLSLSHHMEPDLKLLSNMDHEFILGGRRGLIHISSGNGQYISENIYIFCKIFSTKYLYVSAGALKEHCRQNF